IREIDNRVRLVCAAATAASEAAGGAMVPVPVLVDAGALQVVGLGAGVLQLALDVVVEGADKDAADAGVRRIVARRLANVVDVVAFKAGVVATEDLLVATHQFFAITR